MKIVYIVPGKMEADEAARRERILRSWADAQTYVELAVAANGPRSIECMYEEYLSIPGAVEVAMRKEEEGFDAALLGSGGLPHRRNARPPLRRAQDQRRSLLFQR